MVCSYEDYKNNDKSEEIILSEEKTELIIKGKDINTGFLIEYLQPKIIKHFSISIET